MSQYFFSFFNYGKEAINVIKALVDAAPDDGPTTGKAIAKQEELSSQSPPRALESAFRNLTRVDSALTTKLGPVLAADHSTSRSSTSPSPYPSGDDGIHSSFDAIGKEKDSHDL